MKAITPFLVCWECLWGNPSPCPGCTLCDNKQDVCFDVHCKPTVRLVLGLSQCLLDEQIKESKNSVYMKEQGDSTHT